MITKAPPDKGRASPEAMPAARGWGVLPGCKPKLKINLNINKKINMSTQNIPLPPSANQQSAYYEVSKKNRKIGLSLILGSITGLVLCLFFYVQTYLFSSFTMSRMNVHQQSIVIIGLLGVINLIRILACVPLGIILMARKELVPDAPYDERSGKGRDSVIPLEIKKWNWGAVGLNVIWGIYFNVWFSLLIIIIPVVVPMVSAVLFSMGNYFLLPITLLNFIPIVGFIVLIILGIKGNELAWRKRRWESVDQFLADQKKWEIWGIVFFVISMISLLSSIKKYF